MDGDYASQVICLRENGGSHNHLRRMSKTLAWQNEPRDAKAAPFCMHLVSPRFYCGKPVDPMDGKSSIAAGSLHEIHVDLALVFHLHASPVGAGKSIPDQFKDALRDVDLPGLAGALHA